MGRHRDPSNARASRNRELPAFTEPTIPTPTAPFTEPATEEIPVVVFVDNVVEPQRTDTVILRRPAGIIATAATVTGVLAASMLAGDGEVAEAASTKYTELPSGPISVADLLGPSAAPTVDEVADRLGQQAASRQRREDDERHAADVQAAADQAAAIAAEAARHAAAAEAAEKARQAATEALSTAGRHAAPDDATETVTATTSPALSNGYAYPVPGARITSLFGMRWGALHAGIDFAAPLGTPIYSITRGTVLKAGPSTGFGNAIYIQDENGDVVVYGHMRIMNVSAGDHVAAGDQIALVGNEGESTGPHCHVELHIGGINGKRIDPTGWLSARGISL